MRSRDGGGGDAGDGEVWPGGAGKPTVVEGAAAMQDGATRAPLAGRRFGAGG